MKNLTKAELNYLIDAHLQMDPRHAFQTMDGWAVNYPMSPAIEFGIDSDKQYTKKEFKSVYSKYRQYLNSDIDPAGGYGLHSHE